MAKGLHILIVDDDADLRLTVGRILQRDGYHVSEAENGDQMREIIAEHDIALVILDLMLPGEDGLTLARDLTSNTTIPFIMLTGRGDVVDKVVGLEIGADDYITKPFHGRELTARIGTVLRRSSARAAPSHSPAAAKTKPDIIEFGDWIFNTNNGNLVSRDGQEVILTTYEFQVLAAMATRPNRPLSRDQILDLVGDREWAPYDRSIDVLVGKIRKKLNDNPKSPKYIRTMRNLGYMFISRQNGPE
ncbi:MAG TPA: response regulator [Rhodospirillales bacterium]|nr:response regulator [Rhodospirillales bacterium]